MDDENEIQVINPGRRRRRMTALQRFYFGGGRRRRRNPPKRRTKRRAVAVAAAPLTRMARRRSINRTRHVKGYYPNPGYRRHSRGRRNPVMGAVNNVMDILKDGVIGAAGITANNALGNMTSNLMGLTTPLYRQGVKVASAVIVPSLVGMVAPGLKRIACLAGAMAVAHEVNKLVEAQVLPQLGATGKIFSSSDIAPVVTTTPPAAQQGMYGYISPPYDRGARSPVGYLPGTKYLGYLPGTKYLGSSAPGPGLMQDTPFGPVML